MIIKKRYVIAALIIFIVSIFIMWGPPALMDKTSTPEYCNTCHIMNLEYESWFMTGLHRNIKCVDCHLPNTGFVRHYVWKGIDGMNDMFMFHSGLYSDYLRISNHGKKVVKENCIRCHENMVSVMNTDDRDCWSCHRRVMHTFPSIGMNNN